MRSLFVSLALSLSLPAAAWAQDAGPHHARAGALLALADEEAKIAYAVLTAKVFDVELAKTLLGELKSVVGDAKSSAFRASQLVEDEKSQPELAKLDEALRAVEASLAKLDGDLTNETKGMKMSDDNPDLAPAAGAAAEEKGAQPNWELLKDDLGAFYQGLGAARGVHAKLAKVVKAQPLKAPPAPKKK